MPARLSRDWDNTKEQLDDLRSRLERETDYELEASTTTKMRALFREDDGIVVPRVIPEFSTTRIFTTERLDGVHLDEFLARNPSQELRNAFARKIVVAWYRMMYAGRTIYGDMHPGNFLFLEDGRLGVIDFGFMIDLDERLWALMALADRAITTGRLDDRVAALKEWNSIGDEPAEQERMRLTEQFADWQWRARSDATEFDFGDEADFRRGVDLFVAMVRKRYSRGQPCTPAIARQYFGMRSMLYRLRAKINFSELAEEEVRAAGWDRSEFAVRGKTA
jgi:predicted unusual protein kinase regulating ubiquinone biosynthesis (AarF/ABC1/UbiB family)